MAILPTRNNYQQSASTVLVDLKKGDTSKRNDFVWMYQDRFYAIAYMATGDQNHANELTIMAFQNAFGALKQVNPKQVSMAIWDWLSQFIVDACAEYHSQYSTPNNSNPRTDPSADGSAQMDWETTIILGVQRVKRCLNALPEEQQKVFLLRHNFQLNYDQIGAVLNQTPENVMAWLFRARVQIVKCLGRG
ncbi:MAG: sigma-70 family RNA polymerase sigma factor [Cyanobacteria bacterium SZAS LIN-5]|nr:sigma-70 family RNA polymerase sigma factor [Cyanobacteria bacterium SZAS LIN-5]RTL44080.1 MAG: sigma-70 family RNA polymerase sigma factor [Candidatus Melainabacteria bacterium]